MSGPFYPALNGPFHPAPTEYEYWYRFAPGQTEDLWRLLGCAEAPLSKKLTVLKARVHDLSSFTELRELCDKNGITYGFYSYC